MFKSFMVDVLMSLEPRKIKKGTLIVEENEEWGEVYFFMEGNVAMGYEVNKQKKFVLEFKE